MLSGVPGTRVFPQARGHADAPPAVVPGYAELADDLRAVADSYAATQALGVSMGAGTLLRLLAQTPDRFARVVLFLPAALDTPVRRPAGLVEALEAVDRAVLDAQVRAELPQDLAGPAVEAYVADRVAMLVTGDLAPLVAALAKDPPVVDRALLSDVTARVLVIAQEADPLHPAGVAREVAAALPFSELVVFERPGVLFRERARLRALICGHLAGPSGGTNSYQPGDSDI